MRYFLNLKYLLPNDHCFKIQDLLFISQLLFECCWTTSGTSIFFSKNKANQLLKGFSIKLASEDRGEQEETSTGDRASQL